MLIDCHTHIGQDHGKYWEPRELINSMDEAGIDISLILSNFRGGEGTPIEKALEACDEFPRLKAIWMR